MENLLLSPDEQKIVLKFKKMMERKYKVNIFLPEKVSCCPSDIVVVTVRGEKISLVKNFIQRKLDQMRQRHAQRIEIQNNVTTITLSDSDSDISFPVLMETQQKRKRGPIRRRKKMCGAEKNPNELVDLCSTILIEDSEESANEDTVQKCSNAEKENIVKCNGTQGESSMPAKVDVESRVPTANFVPLDNPQINESVIEEKGNESVVEDKVLDDTIILSDSPPPTGFISLHSKRKNVPNVMDDSDIIIEEVIPRPVAVAKPKCLKPVVVAKPKRLRPVVIDGSNVARAHGGKDFSSKGIQIAVNYFLQRGHDQVTAFVPLNRRHYTFGPCVTTDQPILEELARQQRVVFTPSRKIDNKRITCYDDRFIVDLATKTGGVILSNDNFRDLAAENEEFKKVIQERLLMFCFVGDIIMIPQDPLGRNGPSLENFLAFPD